MTGRLLILCCAVGLMYAPTGCGHRRPERVPVSGRVLIDGKPLTCGVVMIVPQNARPSSGRLDKQGRFRLGCYEQNDGAVPGRHRAAVVAAESINENNLRWLAPKKYSDHRTSGLEVEINAPTDSLCIELTWEGGRPYVE